ncbi:MAG: transglycosylase domain-containing protein [Chitinophagales bacterium]|nr:transglycosylase domain-containing protein [Chitinophagales bacterium]
MQSNHRYSKIIYAIALASFGLMVSVFVFFTAGGIASFEELENPKYDLASVIYDVRGEAFGRYYIEERVALTYDKLSPDVVHALISTEDVRFYKHSGIDLRALSRVGFKTLAFGQKSSGGGSTITQQLAKLLYERPKTSGVSFPKRIFTLVKSKFKEWIIAVKLERAYTKEEILAMYLNKFEFINGAHGIEAAANIYFNKSQADLTIPEAATLVGMLKNPSLYNPKRFPDRCEARRNVVLNLMKDNGYIDKSTLQAFEKEPLDMSSFVRKSQSDGPAPYFRAELTKFLRTLFTKENIKKADGSEYNIYTDGLKIYTTLDLTYQKYAEEAVTEHMIKNQDRFNRIWKNMDPWTYDADNYQKKLRASILESQCKSSDRYLALRDKMLGATLNSIASKYSGIPMSDNIIKTLDSIYTNHKTWHQATEAKKLDVSKQGEYHRLLNDDLWVSLNAQYKSLQDSFQAIFNRPIKMKVFDYDEGEKEVVMSPYDSVRYHKMFLQSAMMVVEPSTGFVKAWVGGVNHKYFKYDHITMRRSVGSTIKPFVYTQAMALAGISPCQEFEDMQYTISPADSGFGLGEEWSPANAEERFSGEKYNLYRGLLYSKNSITVRLIKELGTVEPIRDLMNNLGIDKNLRLENGRLAVPAVPSICLGAVDLTPLEMTGAYTAFANNGSYTQPIFISRIEDKNGKVIYNGIPERKSAINPLYNSVMVSMLSNNVSGSSGMRVKSKIGGKTGTTNDFADGWFMGITPSLVIGVWVGGDDKWIRFRSISEGQGSVMAKPITSIFLQKLEQDNDSGYNYNENFPNPPTGYKELTDCGLYHTERKATEMNTSTDQKSKREVFDEEF